MTNTIAKLQTPGGEDLINVPCDLLVLIALGFPEDRAKELIATAQKEAELAFLVAARRAAYVAEADPLFLEWQYDETAEKEKAWRDKVAEIKARYPLPERT
ncbi:hypothetical protein ACX3YG_14270 [Pseudomonas wadenswilerensis]